MPKARALKPFSSPRFGNVKQNDPVEAEYIILQQMEQHGLVEIIEPKKSKAGGETKPLQSSPAAQVLSGGNASTLETKPKLSPSTPATKQPLGVTPSTDVTPHGGETTTKKSPKKRKRGRKPKSPPKNTG